MMRKKPVICILGATATGKTALAFALANRYPVHLISVDSAQIYREMNIGTAKPNLETLEHYPHALIDILEPEQNYSVAKFCDDARAEIEKAHQIGKIPVLVGGTMLYFYSLFAGLADLPTSSPKQRALIEKRIEDEGLSVLYAELVSRDPNIAAQISPNDRQRLIRFLEMIAVTGKTPTELYAVQEKKCPDWQTLALGLNPLRSVLHDRIALRFQEMIKMGFIEEVAALQKRPILTAEHSSMRSVGYRQIWSFLKGECSKKDAIELGIIATRQLAKRQITWMNNRLTTVLPVEIFDPLLSCTEQNILERVDYFLSENVT